MKDRRNLKIGFTKSGNEGISTRIVLPVAWIEKMGITEEKRDVEAYYDTEKDRIVIEKAIEIDTEAGHKKYLCVFGNDMFEMGKWLDGTITLGYKTNPTAKKIQEGDVIFLYLKGCNLKGIYKVLPKEQWRKVSVKNFETSIQNEYKEGWKSETTQFTIKPVVELTQAVDFRTLINELSFTKFLDSKWMGAIQGHSGVRLLSIKDADILEKAVLEAKEEQE